MSMPELVYMRSHSCSKARENPTKATNAPMAIVIPPSVSRVLRRLRHRFFQANPVKESWDGMMPGKFLLRANFQGGALNISLPARRGPVHSWNEVGWICGFKGLALAAGIGRRAQKPPHLWGGQSTLPRKLGKRYFPERHREPRHAGPDGEKRLVIRTGLCAIIGRALWTHRRCLCAPYSNPGNTPGGRRAAQRARWLAGRSRNRSQMFPVKEPNGSRIPPGRSSLPRGKACNASGSSNHVPERTPDQQS